MINEVRKMRSEAQIKFLASAISQTLNRGSGTKNVLTTVLNDIRQITGIKTLKDYNTQVKDAYIATLQDRIAKGELSTKTTANYISALNQIAEYLHDKKLKTSAKAFNLSTGHKEYTNQSVNKEIHNKFIDYLQDKLNNTQDAKYKSLEVAVKLMHEFGLRAREAISITKDTINQALKTNTLHLTGHDGTKNSRPRYIPVLEQSQKEALKNVIEYMKQNHTQHLFSEKEYTRTQALHFAQSAVQEFKKETQTNYHFHQERHAYAHKRLEQTKDELTVARELGHNRLEKTYIA